MLERIKIEKRTGGEAEIARFFANKTQVPYIVGISNEEKIQKVFIWWGNLEVDQVINAMKIDTETVSFGVCYALDGSRLEHYPIKNSDEIVVKLTDRKEFDQAKSNGVVVAIPVGN